MALKMEEGKAHGSTGMWAIYSAEAAKGKKENRFSPGDSRKEPRPSDT